MNLKKKLHKIKTIFQHDFKYEFYNDIFYIIKKSHPKTFEPINFESTKALDDDGFYLSDYKIHGEPTFEQNLC